jgi:transposase-like protein
MDWPKQSIERRNHKHFKPSHCPWDKCATHTLKPGEGFSYRKNGFYKRRGDGRRVQRFYCKSCKRTFSQQTFSSTYYLKKPKLLRHIAASLNSGSANRQIARALECAPSTVTRLSARLGRHAMLLQAHSLNEIQSISEELTFDHFETFAYSQDQPVGIGMLIGHTSWFIYDLDPAPHRIGGRRTPTQIARAAKRVQQHVPRHSHAESFGRVIDALASKVPEGSRITTITDDHPGYRRAMATHPLRSRIAHRIYPNVKRGPKGSPRSHRAIQRDSAMFPADLLHGLIRHTCANHGRETIAFGRRSNAVLERLFLTSVWRNFVKGRSERKPDRTTPAMALGLASEPWSWSRVLSQRLFVKRVRPSAAWMKIYRREWITPAVGRNQRHTLANAY